MPSIRRWSAVVAGIAVLASLPWLVGHRPVGSSVVGAAALLRQVQESGSAGYSGYAESVGGLSVPVTDQVSSVANLLGGQTELRVWWRGPLNWRVDSIGAFGESDVHRDPAGTWTWEYEDLQATRVAVAADQSVRLPQASDLLPPELGQRLLSEATAAEVSRIAVRRIAGIDAPGLRLTPAQPQSSITRVDVWADPSTGLPLRVDVYGGTRSIPAVSTSFLDFSRGQPAASTTAFTPPVASRVRTASGFDLVSATNSFAQTQPPRRLAGIERSTRTAALGSVGVYGRGVTELVATPLRGRFSNSLRSQLLSAGAVAAGPRTSLGVGPLNLLLLQSDGGGAWLLSGTVTAATLQKAATDLAGIPVGRR